MANDAATSAFADRGQHLFNEDERCFRADLRRWLRANPSPDLDAFDVYAAWLGCYRSWEHDMYRAGFSTLQWPIRYGGRGLPASYGLIAEEELAIAHVVSFRHRPTILGTHMAGSFLATVGTDAQRARYLPPILRAEELWCQLFSEPQAGSDLAGLRTTAVEDGDSFVMNGQKVWNSYAHIADHGVLIARTGDAPSPGQAFSVFVLDMHSDRIDVRPLHQANGNTEYNEVFLTDVRIPMEHLIGEVGAGWALIRGFLKNERSAIQLGSNAEMLVRCKVLLAGAGDAPPATRDRLVALWSRLAIQRWTALAIVSGMSKADGPISKVQWTRNQQWLSESEWACAGLDAQAWPWRAE